MIRSMTGFGAARREEGGVSVGVELRSVNGRFLKVSMRLPSLLTPREHEIEALVKAKVRRASLTLKIDLSDTRPEALVTVNEDVVRAYQAAFRRLGVSEAPLATLPGVLGAERAELSDETLAVVTATVNQALDALTAMRKREGEALGRALLASCQVIEDGIAHVRERAPSVLHEHRARLQQRLAALVEGFGTPADEQLVARELALYADRCDIAEELERLGSHLEQARALVSGDEEAGRTLEFLSQEMLREVNTMGSKSADVDLTRTVIKLKAELERFKEQIANVE